MHQGRIGGGRQMFGQPAIDFGNFGIIIELGLLPAAMPAFDLALDETLRPAEVFQA